MMAVPLQTKQRIIGLIYLDSPFVLREFTTDDLSLLTVMANVAAIRIENVRLAEVEEADRIMQRDLTQAAEIQRRMLPDVGAAGCRGADLAGVQRGRAAPWAETTTTFFPLRRQPRRPGAGRRLRQRYAGLPHDDGAACARGRCWPKTPGWASVQIDTGRSGVVHRRRPRTRPRAPSAPPTGFHHLFFTVMDAATGELAFANAGHNPPIVVRASGESADAGRRRPRAGRPGVRSVLGAARASRPGRPAGAHIATRRDRGRERQLR